jgi:hypothetical protein
LLDGILDGQLDEFGVDRVADPPHHFLLDRLGLAADLGREVPTSPLVEPGHLGEARGLPVGMPVAELRHQV